MVRLAKVTYPWILNTKADFCFLQSLREVFFWADSSETSKFYKTTAELVPGKTRKYVRPYTDTAEMPLRGLIEWMEHNGGISRNHHPRTNEDGRIPCLRVGPLVRPRGAECSVCVAIYVLAKLRPPASAQIYLAFCQPWYRRTTWRALNEHPWSSIRINNPKCDNSPKCLLGL